MNNNCNSSCWWRCGIPSLEHISIEVQNEIFSKPMWFLEQDCDDNCYCSTNDNLGDSCNDGDIKYGECVHYTSWSTTEYHTCEDQKPPLTTCGDGCCDTYDGKKTCCDGKCVLSTKCCGGKILGLNEQCCDGKIIQNKCDRFILNEEFTIQNNNIPIPPCPAGAIPCPPFKPCGCDFGQVCCGGTCVNEAACCGNRPMLQGQTCCTINQNIKGICAAGQTCIPGWGCCPNLLILDVNGNKGCCTNGTVPCGDVCCPVTECVGGVCACKPGEIPVKPPGCGIRVCLTRREQLCGCNQICHINETCTTFTLPTGSKIGKCCPKGKFWVVNRNAADPIGQGYCCRANRIGTIDGQTVCCPVGQKVCADGKCRKVCKNCISGGGSEAESCELDEICCLGYGCHSRNNGQKCCFPGTPLAHLCDNGQLCCGSKSCCEGNTVCCGDINNIADLECMDRNVFKCCAFGPCKINQTCCGPNCCEPWQTCVYGQCFTFL